MDCSPGNRAVVQALRLGLPPERIARVVTPVTIRPETLIIRCSAHEDPPLLLCLHPSRLCEFQCAQKLRDLEHLTAHLAFPRGLFPREVDLGGARTVGYGWYQYTGDNPASKRSLVEGAEYLDAVLARLDEALGRQNNRLYVIGIEDAAPLALLWALRQAPRSGAVAVVDGRLRPGLIAELSQASAPLRLLRIRHQTAARRGDPGAETHALEALGFAVDEEWVPACQKSWEEETGVLISWLSQKAGLAIAEEQGGADGVAAAASGAAGAAGSTSP